MSEVYKIKVFKMFDDGIFKNDIVLIGREDNDYYYQHIQKRLKEELVFKAMLQLLKDNKIVTNPKAISVKYSDQLTLLVKLEYKFSPKGFSTEKLDLSAYYNDCEYFDNLSRISLGDISIVVLKCLCLYLLYTELIEDFISVLADECVRCYGIPSLRKELTDWLHYFVKNYVQPTGSESILRNL